MKRRFLNMVVDIRAIGFNLTDAIRMHVESRVQSALGAFSRQILTATARLEDVNASRGGIDKRCSLVVAIRGKGVVVAEAIHEDLYAAVDEAAAKIRRPVLQHIDRRTARERHNRQRPGALVAI